MTELAGLPERKAAFNARTAHCLRLGFDRFAAADFVAVKDLIRFVCGDASALSFPDGNFGCAVIGDILHRLQAVAPVLAKKTGKGE